MSFCKRKIGSGASAYTCERPVKEGSKMCAGCLAKAKRTNARGYQNRKKARAFVPDFIKDPSKLPKAPPGRAS